jgi:hypothetical protein
LSCFGCWRCHGRERFNWLVFYCRVFRKFRLQQRIAVANGVSVIAISITRLVFVIEGQWNADQSWACKSSIPSTH